mmetsp:Transcript_127/g.287  ORF Transcript_127/g.287 Transcript_127/m.287 type:complete len:205 (+) Transcript_127:194-808(+)
MKAEKSRRREASRPSLPAEENRPTSETYRSIWNNPGKGPCFVNWRISKIVNKTTNTHGPAPTRYCWAEPRVGITLLNIRMMMTAQLQTPAPHYRFDPRQFIESCPWDMPHCFRETKTKRELAPLRQTPAWSVAPFSTDVSPRLEKPETVLEIWAQIEATRLERMATDRNECLQMFPGESCRPMATVSKLDWPGPTHWSKTALVT